MKHQVLHPDCVVEVPYEKVLHYGYDSNGRPHYFSQKEINGSDRYFIKEVKEFMAEANAFIWWKYKNQWTRQQTITMYFTDPNDAVSFKLRFM